MQPTRRRWKEGDRSYGPLYENAAILLMRGGRTSALEWLERAFAAGLRHAAILQHDPMLAALRGDPRFVELLERMRKDVREMRARVDLSELDKWIDGTAGPLASPASRP